MWILYHQCYAVSSADYTSLLHPTHGASSDSALLISSTSVPPAGRTESCRRASWRDGPSKSFSSGCAPCANTAPWSRRSANITSAHCATPLWPEDNHVILFNAQCSCCTYIFSLNIVYAFHLIAQDLYVAVFDVFLLFGRRFTVHKICDVLLLNASTACHQVKQLCGPFLPSNGEGL